MVDELNQKQKQLQASIAKQRKQYARLNERIDKLIQAEIEAAERRRKAEAERRRKAELARQKRLKAQREKAARETARRKGKSTSKSKSTKKKTQRDDEDESTATPNFTPANDVDRVLSNSFAANRWPTAHAHHGFVCHHYALRTVQRARTARRKARQQGHQHHRTSGCTGSCGVQGRSNHGIYRCGHVSRHCAPRLVPFGLLQPFVYLGASGAASQYPPNSGQCAPPMLRATAPCTSSCARKPRS